METQRASELKSFDHKVSPSELGLSESTFNFRRLRVSAYCSKQAMREKSAAIEQLESLFNLTRVFNNPSSANESSGSRSG